MSNDEPKVTKREAVTGTVQGRYRSGVPFTVQMIMNNPEVQDLIKYGMTEGGEELPPRLDYDALKASVSERALELLIWQLLIYVGQLENELHVERHRMAQWLDRHPGPPAVTPKPVEYVRRSKSRRDRSGRIRLPVEKVLSTYMEEHPEYAEATAENILRGFYAWLRPDVTHESVVGSGSADLES